MRSMLWAAVALVAAAFAAEADDRVAGWPFVGGDLHNTRNAPREKTISPATAARLAPRWATVIRGAAQETPVADGDMLYVANGNGELFMVARADGAIKRQIDLRAL